MTCLLRLLAMRFFFYWSQFITAVLECCYDYHPYGLSNISLLVEECVCIDELKVPRLAFAFPYYKLRTVIVTTKGEE